MQPKSGHFAKIFFLAITLLCTGIAAYGHYTHEIVSTTDISTAGNLPESLYRTLQMFVAGLDLQHTRGNWQLESMRFVLPALTLTTAIFAFLSLTGRYVQFLRLLVRPPTTIYLGAGRKASGLARANDGAFKGAIIAIDVNVDQEYARMMASKGIRLFEADATDSRVLAKLHLGNAEQIVIATGDDDRNIVIARKVCQLPAVDDATIVVAVSDNTLARVAAEDPDFGAYNRREDKEGRIIWLNVFTQTARGLLQRFPPDRYRSPGGSGGPVHVGIVGFGEFGQEILLQAIRSCVYADECQVRFTVFTTQENQDDEFFLRYPALDKQFGKDPVYQGLTPLADVNFVRYAGDYPGPVMMRRANDICPLSIVYVTADTDYDALNAAEGVAQVATAISISCPVVCCIPGSRFPDMRKTQSMLKPGTDAGILYYHAMHDWIGPNERYPGETADAMGMIVNWEYSDQSKPENNTDISAWMKCPEVNRWSSRQAADHVAIKLRAIGFDLRHKEEAVGDSGNQTEDQEQLLNSLQMSIESNLEMLKRMEHRRYCTERILNGWLYEKGKNNPRRLNPTLIPYEELPTDEEGKDERIVKSIRKLLQNGSYRLERSS